MPLFVSYSSRDVAAVRAMVQDLQRARLEVWFDEELRGGDVWWDEILGRIRASEVFVFAVSDNSRASKACKAELQYARDLGMHIVPVQVGPLGAVRVIELANLQIIPYVDRSVDSVIDLVSVVQEKAAHPRTLPDVLPEPPPVPYAYLLRLSAEIEAPSLTIDQQADLVRQLREGLEDEQDEGVREDIRTLLRALRRRNDLTVRNAADIDRVLTPVADRAGAGASSAGGSSATSAAPTASAPSAAPSAPAASTTSTAPRPSTEQATRPTPAPAPAPSPSPSPSPQPSPSPATPRVPAGWYPDSGGSGMRYWDGTAWTDHRSPGAPTTGPTPAPRPAPVAMPNLPAPPRAPGQSNVLSIVAMVLGVLGVFFFLFGVAGIVCALVGRSKQEPRWQIGLWIAIGGTVVGFLVLIASSMNGQYYY
ncbi:TIR domain-containing protein [Cellulomonas sp. ICMP 17802]|uniref:TIR domain-containing protein n=1 Tax=Cellulomonas sp. ICMP 17802 TaxID=3239199 RepID=UPI00351B9CF8